MKVQELLQYPERWTQGTACRDENGSPVRFDHPEGCSYSLWGAIRVCYPEAYLDVTARVLVWLWISEQARVYKLFRWNDDPKRSHTEITNLCKDLNI